MKFNPKSLKNAVISALCTSFIFSSTASAEIVCFELSGEFGEEIRAVLEKYKNQIENGDIKTIKNNSMLQSYLPAENTSPKELQTQAEKAAAANGITLPPSPKLNTQNSVNGIDLALGERLYSRDCASCHGAKGEEKVLDRAAINTWSAEDIATELYHYQTYEFTGRSRFIKNQIAQRYIERDRKSIGAFVAQFGKNTK